MPYRFNVLTGKLDLVNPASTGGLTQVTADAPLAGLGTSVSHLSIPKATALVDGYLAAADFQTFAGKQDNLGLTDPGANRIAGWDDTDNAWRWFTIGTNLSYDHATHTLSSTGSGGMTNPMTTLGDIIFENATPVPDRLGGNTTATVKYLQSVGIGGVAQAPSWQQIAYSDISGTPTAHNILSTTHGDTLADTVARGDVLIGNATPKWSRLAFPGTPTGKVLQATATDIAWSANPLTIGASASVSGSNTGDQTLAGLGGATIALDNLASVAMNASLQWNNTAARTFGIAATANTVAGQPLTISAGSTVTGGTADMAGGNLTLNSGLGKGTGASSIIFQTGRTLTTGSTLQTLTEAMRILGNGNVGIGTTNPLAVMDVRGAVLINGMVAGTGTLGIKQNEDTQYGGLTMYNTGSSGSVRWWIDSSAVMRLDNLTNANGKIALNGAGSGNVAIGYTDPGTAKLAVNGNVGIGTTSPTAYLHLKAGTATAGTAPLKLTQASAVVLTTPEAGTLEVNDGDALYYTIKTGPTRKTIAFTDSPITSSMYLGTTAVALNRETGALTLAGITLTTPNIGDATANTINIVPASGAGTVTGPTITMTSTETQAVGDAVMIDSNGKCHLAKADTLADAGAILLAASAPSGSASATYLRPGGTLKLASSPSWTVGGFVYLSATGTTGNTLTQTAPTGANNAVLILGVAIAADTLLFEPGYSQIEYQ